MDISSEKLAILLAGRPRQVNKGTPLMRSGIFFLQQHKTTP